MHHHIIGMFIVAALVIAVLAIVIFSIYNSMVADKEEKLALIEARNKERIALIDKGMDPSLADNKKFSRPPYNSLMWGLLLVGVSAGFFIGYIIVENFGGNANLVVHAMGILFGGIGLLIYYFLRNKKDSK